MYNTVMGFVLGILMVISLMVIMAPLVGLDFSPRENIQACQEDELLRGEGQFNSDGLWTRYTCTHPDTFTQEGN